MTSRLWTTTPFHAFQLPLQSDVLGNHRIVMLVAAAENGVIGSDGNMPWHLPDDLRRFKDTTMGHPIVMGRRTWESIGRPLPGRTNIILTRDPNYTTEGGHAATDTESMLRHAGDDDTVMVIGGGEIYRMLLPATDEIHITRVHAHVDGDTTFPSLDDRWVKVGSEYHDADPRHAYAMTFETWRRS